MFAHILLQIKSKRYRKARELSDRANELIARSSGTATLEDVRRWGVLVVLAA